MSWPAFIRYYLAGISAVEWGAIQTLLPQDGWTITSPRDFKFEESYGFQPTDAKGARRVQRALETCNVVVEHHDPAQVIGKSVLWVGNHITVVTVIDDLITLMSVAANRQINYVYLEYSNGNGSRDWAENKSSLPDYNPMPGRVVATDNYVQFLTDALTSLRVGLLNWFITSVLWYVQAQRMYGKAPTLLELSVYWITVEVLANARKIKGGKKTMVKTLFDQLGYKGPSWSFLDSMITDWCDLRNSAFHEGNEGKLAQATITRRKRQVMEFTSLVLADLLVPLEVDWKETVASRIASY